MSEKSIGEIGGNIQFTEKGELVGLDAHNTHCCFNSQFAGLACHTVSESDAFR